MIVGACQLHIGCVNWFTSLFPPNSNLPQKWKTFDNSASGSTDSRAVWISLGPGVMDVWRIRIFYDNNYQDLQVTTAYIIGKTWAKDHHLLGNGLNHRQPSFMTDSWCDQITLHSGNIWGPAASSRGEERRGEMVGCDGDSAGVRLGSQWWLGLSTCDIVMGRMVCSPACTPLYWH